MKTEHITLVLAIAREKSVSRAAELFFISQPTASNMLKAIENELGFPIFLRTRNGMIPTLEGAEFIEYAEIIERSLKAVSRIQQPNKRISFKVLSLKNNFSVLAFEKLSEKYFSDQGHTNFDFLYQTISTTNDGLRLLEKGNGDIAIVVCRRSIYEASIINAAKMHLETAAFANTHLEITCNKSHPILQNGTIQYDLLSKYTCFSTIHTSGPDYYAPYLLAKNIMDVQNTIILFNCDSRFRLLNKSNGFLISPPIPEELKEKYNLQSVPVDDSDLTIFAVYREDSHKKDIIREYIDLCKSLCYDI